MVAGKEAPMAVLGPRRATQICVAVVITAGLSLGTALAQGPPGAAPKPAVTVVAVEKRPVAQGLSFTGRVVAINRVDIRARVSGFLQEQHFREGQDVNEGDLLFTIEKDILQAQVEQRNADLEAARATSRNAEIQLERARELLPRQTISQAVHDQREADLRVANAQVLQAQAALRQAEINLGYAEIRSPVAGRIGRAAFQKGALVGPESGALATVVSQDPIHVTFPVSQRQILEVQKRLGERARDPASAAVVRIQLPDDSIYPETGKIDFADVTVDRSTDTLTVRAVFPNKDRILVDGQFVRLRAEDREPELALLVPQRAILNDQAGPYVFVVASDGRAQARRVKLGGVQGPDVIVQEGLEPGERVITDGIQKVRPGVAVDAAPAAPAARG
jgi:membrane fusion protein (multidrug efflux system)